MSDLVYKICAIILGLNCIFRVRVHGQFAFDWCYDEGECERSPSKWNDTCLNGRLQSPINIVTSTATVRPGPPATVTFSKGYCTDLEEWDINNYGISLDITPPEELTKKPWHYAVAGEVYKGDYVFSTLDFHWAATSTEGASHEIDGKKFALEMHLVGTYLKHPSHSKANDDEKKEVKGSLFTTVLFEIGDDNPALEPVIKSLPQVVESSPDKLKRIKDKLNIFKLLPGIGKREVYRYEGSSDVPIGTSPCGENALWDIFAEPMKVSERQMAEFRKLKAFNGKPFMRSARRVLEVKDHKIEKIVLDISCKGHFNCSTYG